MQALEQSIQLPCGAVLKNRIAKSAMSEGLADAAGSPVAKLQHLYRLWADGGAGLLITGNVMIDARALGEPGNVIVENENHLAALTAWAESGKKNGTHIWPQLNHPGRQAMSLISKEVVAPSAVPLANLKILFKGPRALSEIEIQNSIERFGNAARILKKAGFTGVQLHGAHGYLVSQFLSPLVNQRNDKWGGTLENRMRFLLDTMKSIRTNVGHDFPVSVKLNSADFQRGGFSESDAEIVCLALSDAKVDLIELSGGTYEKASMTGIDAKESTKKREAYFIEFAEGVRSKIKTPLMLTGGFRSGLAINAAIANHEIDVAGIARPMAIDPDYPNKLISGESIRLELPFVKTGVDMIDRSSGLEIPWYNAQLARLAEGKSADLKMSAWKAGWHLSSKMAAYSASKVFA